ncbi:MAG TPA: hypothetical protein VK983_05840 [Candidatus Limnocylindrales bacterium]|nr:hypothetical protein [Candidatus Limnocylindrales bacterium]
MVTSFYDAYAYEYIFVRLLKIPEYMDGYQHLKTTYLNQDTTWHWFA